MAVEFAVDKNGLFLIKGKASKLLVLSKLQAQRFFIAALSRLCASKNR